MSTLRPVYSELRTLAGVAGRSLSGPATDPRTAKNTVESRLRRCPITARPPSVLQETGKHWL